MIKRSEAIRLSLAPETARVFRETRQLHYRSALFSNPLATFRQPGGWLLQEVVRVTLNTEDQEQVVPLVLFRKVKEGKSLVENPPELPRLVTANGPAAKSIRGGVNMEKISFLYHPIAVIDVRTAGDGALKLDNPVGPFAPSLPASFLSDRPNPQCKTSFWINESGSIEVMEHSLYGSQVYGEWADPQSRAMALPEA